MKVVGECFLLKIDNHIARVFGDFEVLKKYLKNSGYTQEEIEFIDMEGSLDTLEIQTVPFEMSYKG